jgi:hypothetical protein
MARGSRARRVALAGLLFLSVVAAPAAAHSASAGVSVRVLPSRPAPLAFAELPLPASTQALTRDRFGGSFHFPGHVAAAEAFFRDALAGRGYRLRQSRRADGAVEQYWDTVGAQLRLELQQVLGPAASTRIVVQASDPDGP